MNESAKRGILSFAMRIVQYITTDLIPAEPRIPVDRGAYRAGWQYKKTSKGAEIYNNAPHAMIVEYGVRPENVKPGPAMREALKNWLMRKGIVQDEKEAVAVAWAIAMKMKKTGIFNTPAQGGKPGGGLRILERAMRKVDPWLVEEIAREIERGKTKK